MSDFAAWSRWLANLGAFIGTAVGVHIGWVDHGVVGSLIGMVVGAIGGFIAGAFLAGALIPLSLLAGLAIVLWALQYLQAR